MDEPRFECVTPQDHAVYFAEGIHDKLENFPVKFRQAVRINPMHDGHLRVSVRTIISAAAVAAEVRNQAPVGQGHQDHEEQVPVAHDPVVRAVGYRELQ